MNVLVLGGTRFIGRALVDGLLRQGADVTLLHTGHHDPFGDRVTHRIADRKDHRALQRALRGYHFDVVFEHAYVHPAGTRVEDVEATLQALSKLPKRVVFTRSAAVYEVVPHSQKPLSEDAAYATRGDAYSVDKITTERFLLDAHQRGDFEVSIIRPSFVIGPYSPGQRLGFFWDRLLAGRPIILPDGGTTKLQMAFVHDVADALICAATDEHAKGAAFNIGWEDAMTQRALIADLARVAGVEALVAEIPRARLFEAGASPFDAPHYFGESLDISGVLGEFHLSTARAKQALPLIETPWEAALSAAYEWYQSQRSASPELDTKFEDLMLRGAPVMALETPER